MYLRASRPIATILFAYFLTIVPTLAQNNSPQPAALTTTAGTQIKHDAATVEDYLTVLAANPSDSIAMNNLGALYVQNGRLDEGIRLLEQAAEARPEVWNYQLNASIALTQKGELIAALKFAQAAFKAAPKELRVREQLCDLYIGIGNGPEAVACFGPLVKDAPNETLDALGYGEALLMSGDYATAESVIEGVIQASPRLASAYNALGTLQFRRKRYAEAIETFREAISLDPAQPKFRFNMGVAEMAARDREGALSQYRFLKDSDPKLADQLYSMMFSNMIVAAPEQ